MSAALSFWLTAEATPVLGMLRRDRGAIASLATERLSRLLFRVARTNEFYGRRLQAAQIEWADPVIRGDPYGVLAALAPVSKTELREAGSRVLDKGALGRGWFSSTSSGSTGEPFRVYYDARAWAILKYLVKFRARAACGVTLSDRVALLDAIPPVPSKRVPRWAHRLTHISVLQPASAVAAALRSFAPDTIYGLPSALLEASRHLSQLGEQRSVRAVFTSGELLQRSTREALAAAFGAPVYDIYGTSETKEIAWECPAGNRHLNSDVVHMEAVDESGRSLPPGIEGELVATLLVSTAMPLIRYRTGDRGSLVAGSCSCGCPMPLLGVVTGRAADILVMRGGIRISPYALTCAIERIPGVLRYQVSQLDPARVRVRAILESAADRNAVTAQVQNALRYDVAPFLDADVEFVDRLPVGPRAKFRVVEPMQ